MQPDEPVATAAGRPRKAADSARWCERCQKWGDHHTDRHDECAPTTAACPLTFGPHTCDLPAGHRDWHHCPTCPTETENAMPENMTRDDALALRDAAYATGVVDERMGRAAIPDDREPGYTDSYPLDYNGWAVVSRPFIRVRADEVVVGDLLILDSGLSRVTGTKRYDLLNGVTTVHITGPTNIVRATHETVTVLRNGT